MCRISMRTLALCLTQTASALSRKETQPQAALEHRVEPDGSKFALAMFRASRMDSNWLVNDREAQELAATTRPVPTESRSLRKRLNVSSHALPGFTSESPWPQSPAARALRETRDPLGAGRTVITLVSLLHRAAYGFTAAVIMNGMW